MKNILHTDGSKHFLNSERVLVHHLKILKETFALTFCSVFESLTNFIASFIPINWLF